MIETIISQYACPRNTFCSLIKHNKLQLTLYHIVINFKWKELGLIRFPECAHIMWIAGIAESY